MTLLPAIVPVVLLVALMTVMRPRRWLPLPAHVALPAVAMVAFGLQLLQPGRPTAALVHAAVIDGVLSSLTPLAIVFGAILLFASMEKSGALATLAAWLRRLSPDPVAQLMIVGWAFSFLVEGLSGFGTPAALAAPLLVGLGFPPLRVAAMCLVMNSVPVSFGAAGTPTWFGLGGVDLVPAEVAEIGWRTALVHAAASPVIVAIGLLIVVPWTTIRPRLVHVLLVTVATIAPFLLTARFSVEFPSIVGGAVGLFVAAGLSRRRIGLPSVADDPRRTGATRACDAPLSLSRALLPLAVTVAILAATRIDALGLKALLTSDTNALVATIPGVGEAWISPSMVVGLRSILGTETHWRMPLLYVPFILPFVVVSIACVPLLRMTRRATAAAWSESLGRMARPAAAMAGALVLAKMMTVGGDRSAAAQIGHAAADFAGPAWPMLAPLLGALGSFFSGSNTVSNLTFAPIQDAIAATLGLDRISILALQSAGGAMGNMVCIHNIVAVGAMLGLVDRGGGDHGDAHVASVLRLAVGPLAAYAIVAATMAIPLTL